MIKCLLMTSLYFAFACSCLTYSIYFPARSGTDKLSYVCLSGRTLFVSSFTTMSWRYILWNRHPRMINTSLWVSEDEFSCVLIPELCFLLLRTSLISSHKTAADVVAHLCVFLCSSVCPNEVVTVTCHICLFKISFICWADKRGHWRHQWRLMTLRTCIS